MVILAIVITCTFVLSTVAQEKYRLQVSQNGRSLQYANGKPFFWLGDTAWELFSRLTLNEIKMYLDNRAAKGFNVIQVSCLTLNDVGKQNRYGEMMLHPLNGQWVPNDKYFTIIDSTLQYALERNMYLAMVPTWGDLVVSGELNSLQANTIGKWLGSRYAQHTNIIWVLGGDKAATTNTQDFKPIWREMAKGIIEGTNQKCLITYHPNGERSSSEWLHTEPWLDFNMIQSSHGRKDAPVWDMVKKDRSLSPAKPTLDSEPNYEDHPVSPWPKWNVDNGYFRDYDVRKQLYRSVFAGAFGVSYGHHAIWQFFNERVEALNFPDRGWVNALDRPGAFQAGYLRQLIESRPSENRVPDANIITQGQGEAAQRIEVLRDSKGKFILVYLPLTKEIELDMSGISSKRIIAWWYNPKTGDAQKIGTLNKKTLMKFEPTQEPDHSDWVLVLDDAEMKYSSPASSSMIRKY
ncbi:DUF4038 domain-containing protein [Rhodocytophaga rosea]|uniref:DUF4038 domain-containing protein n=1 Tax=Rhodocytophaga rosea TaxID=2704465 RepID=A0A6C0GX18_9BACT|nr:DUF4038 domain-containing protein [Rhodocytophaga rosea]